MKKKETMDEERRAFLSKVAAVSIATAFGGVTAMTRSEAQGQSYKITSKGPPPDRGKPDGSALEEGDLAKIADAFNEHPDAAVRALMKQTAMGLATNESARNQFSSNVRGSLKVLNVDVPAGLLPSRLNVPAGIQQAATKRKGWGIGAGHSNRNNWTNHSNHNRYSDYTDWW